MNVDQVRIKRYWTGNGNTRAIINGKSAGTTTTSDMDFTIVGLNLSGVTSIHIELEQDEGNIGLEYIEFSSCGANLVDADDSCYVMASDQVGMCPAGSSRITTADECTKAAIALGETGTRSAPAIELDWNASNTPPGCWIYNDELHFNTDDLPSWSGDNGHVWAICKSCEVYEPKDGLGQCGSLAGNAMLDWDSTIDYTDPNTDTREKCEAHCSSEPNCYAYSWKVSYTGCFIHLDNNDAVDTYFNLASGDGSGWGNSNFLAAPFLSMDDIVASWDILGQGHWDATCYVRQGWTSTKGSAAVAVKSVFDELTAAHCTSIRKWYRANKHTLTWQEIQEYLFVHYWTDISAYATFEEARSDFLVHCRKQ